MKWGRCLQESDTTGKVSGCDDTTGKFHCNTFFTRSMFFSFHFDNKLLLIKLQTKNTLWYICVSWFVVEGWIDLKFLIRCLSVLHFDLFQRHCGRKETSQLLALNLSWFLFLLFSSCVSLHDLTEGSQQARGRTGRRRNRRNRGTAGTGGEVKTASQRCGIKVPW